LSYAPRLYSLDQSLDSFLVLPILNLVFSFNCFRF